MISLFTKHKLGAIIMDYFGVSREQSSHDKGPPPSNNKSATKSVYRITIRGKLPSDISSRISALHAMAIQKRLEAESTSDLQQAVNPATPDEQPFTQLRE